MEIDSEVLRFIISKETYYKLLLITHKRVESCPLRGHDTISDRHAVFRHVIRANFTTKMHQWIFPIKKLTLTRDINHTHNNLQEMLKNTVKTSRNFLEFSNDGFQVHITIFNIYKTFKKSEISQYNRGVDKFCYRASDDETLFCKKFMIKTVILSTDPL